MRLRTFHLLFVVFALPFFYGCSESHLAYKDAAITMSIDTAVQNAEAATLSTKSSNFQTLFLKQHTLKLKDGSFGVYEEGYTDINFQFEHGTQKMVEVIFETKDVRLIYGKAFLNFYRLVLSNGEVLNLIVQRNTDQHISLFYGMSTQTFNALIKGFDKDAPISVRQNIQLSSQDTIKTRWDVRKVHFYPLVVPFRFKLGL